MLGKRKNLYLSNLTVSRSAAAAYLIRSRCLEGLASSSADVSLEHSYNTAHAHPLSRKPIEAFFCLSFGERPIASVMDLTGKHRRIGLRGVEWSSYDVCRAPGETRASTGIMFVGRTLIHGARFIAEQQ